MTPFHIHTGLVAPIDRENVDTDAIIPKQFLKSIKKSGFGPNLFDAWRYLDHGEPGQDPASRRPNPDFVLNQARYQGASDRCTIWSASMRDRRESRPTISAPTSSGTATPRGTWIRGPAQRFSATFSATGTPPLLRSTFGWRCGDCARSRSRCLDERCLQERSCA